jgi:3-methyl-2-oxobutanoate hydroxymethyltransferase
LGGYKVQGKDLEAARRMIGDALALEQAGACAVVLECVPSPLAGLISKKLSIPTIGIGAGADCDGQVLVYHDVLGLYTGRRPKFVKQYTDARAEMLGGVQNFIREVREGLFPSEEHGFAMPQSVVDQLM